MSILRQERHVEYISGGVQSFVITSSLAAVDKGVLPHPFVFVYSIVDRNDPKADTFARIATLADLTTLPQGRDAGLAAGSGVNIEFLQTSSVLSYSDLETATQAAKTVQDRMDTLVEDWSSYMTDFLASPTPAAITLPSVALTTKQGLIDAFKQAKQTLYAQTVTATATSAALSAAQATYNGLKTDVQQLQLIYANAVTASSAYGTSRADLLALRNAAVTYVTAAAGTPTATTINAAIAAAVQADIVDGLTATQIAAGVVLVGSLLDTKTTALAAAATALSAAATADAVAQQALADDQTAETAALTALLAVCPSFDATTICNVAG
jgi:hypothetical protein